jgi:hypothetical protein
MKKEYFIWATLFYTITIFYLASTIPITPHEAKILYTSQDILNILMIFGEKFLSGVLGLRIVFLFFGFLSIVFFYELSNRYFIKPEDTYLSTFIFMFLPGIVTGTILVNISIIVLPLVLLFVLLYEKNHFVMLPFVMLALFFIHKASIVFFIAVLLYGLFYKDNKLSIVSGIFLLLFVYLAKGIEVGGIPSGHFAEIFGLYAAVFSPFVFFYFFYTMYRIFLREKKTLLWYISFTALAFSLILSIRQRVHLTDFLPYVMIAIPLMLDMYNRSIRVRLPEYQKRYKFGFKIVVSSMILSMLFLVTYQVMFFVVDNHKKYFSNSVYKPYFLAKELKIKGIYCKDTLNIRESYQLQYYNIAPCTK